MKLALLLLTAFLVRPAFAVCTTEVEVVDVIGPATVDLMKRVERQAEQQKCSSLLLLINTPGGSLESTRLLVEMMLNSTIPYLCLVSPSGGHAGSAGAILLQACHVNGGLNGTNLGAATPVAIGKELPQDLRQKIVNDTRSWMESLTLLRGRNEKFGQDIILEAKAVTSEEAVKLKALDFVGPTKAAFLDFAQGRSVKLKDGQSASVQVGTLEHFELDVRYKVVSLLTDPELAYMLLLASLALLYFEITHSGVILPGVVGAIGLIIALMALNRLDVEWAGLALIFVGIAMLIAEMFLPTFGILGAGGLVAFTLGSLFLFDPVRSFGYHLPYSYIAATAIILTLFFLGVSWLFLKTTRVKRKGGFEDLLHLRARVVRSEDSGHSGQVEVRGEIWNFESTHPLEVGDWSVIKGHRGLILKVSKQEA